MEYNLEDVAALARRAAAQIVTGADTREYVVISNDSKLVELPGGFQPMPPRIRQKLTLTNKDSFVDYVSAFADNGSRIFADINTGRFVAALDYHTPDGAISVVSSEGRSDEAIVRAGAQALDHMATFALQVSEEWKRWSEISGKLMQQVDFLRFIEENAADVSQPMGADLLEICQDFRAHRNVKFMSSKRLQTGEESFEYQEEIRGQSRTGEINVPNKFELTIPVYFGEPTLQVYAFLRFRLDPFVMGVELHRPEYVRQACFQAIGRDIAERTRKPVHYGALQGASGSS